MKKIVKLTETDLYNIVRKTINEMDDDGVKVGDPVKNFVDACDDVSSAYYELEDLKMNGGDSMEDYQKLNNKISKLIFNVENVLQYGKSAHRALSDELNDTFHSYKRKEIE